MLNYYTGFPVIVRVEQHLVDIERTTAEDTSLSLAFSCGVWWLMVIVRN